MSVGTIIRATRRFTVLETARPSKPDAITVILEGSAELAVNVETLYEAIRLQLKVADAFSQRCQT